MELSVGKWSSFNEGCSRWIKGHGNLTNVQYLQTQKKNCRSVCDECRTQDEALTCSKVQED